MSVLCGAFCLWDRLRSWINASLGTDLPTKLYLGFGTLLIAHITFNIPYVILSVMPKLRQMDKNLVDAAQDLGCTWMQAFWKVVVPEIKPGIVNGLLIAFTMSRGRLCHQLLHRRLHDRHPGHDASTPWPKSASARRSTPCPPCCS